MMSSRIWYVCARELRDSVVVTPEAELLRRLVEIESPTGGAAGIAAIGELIAAELRAIGASVEHREGGAVVGYIGEAVTDPLLVMAHMDTVWPVGTLAKMPVRIEDGFFWGPGSLDMKAGIVIALEALRGIGATPRPVIVLVTADEEIGSPQGRLLVEELARSAAAALVVEPPVREGTVTTARSGLARYQMYIQGRSAHAGNGHRGGVSAIDELAHQTIALHALADGIQGARINVGQVGGGSGDNVVAAEAWARIDARAWTSEGQQQLEAAIHGLRPRLEGAQLRVEGGITRPPMNQSHVAERLAQRAIEIAAGIGLEVDQNTSAGGSDGNFAAAAGIPVLDGLGPDGVGAHAIDERVSLNSLAERIQLLRALLLEL
jgi:glutamate carboxypeptidase